MARDPVCGMNVKKDEGNKGYRSEYKGRDYHFCSDECRREFLRDPDNYIRPDDADRDDRRNKEEELARTPREDRRDRE